MPVLKDGVQLPDAIDLLDRQSGVVAPGWIEELTRETAKNRIDLAWWPEQPDVPKAARRAERDSTWKWVGLLGELRQVGRNGFAWAVRTDDGACQGAILYQVGCESALDPARPTVYCWRIATAPRNRPWLSPAARYRGVGTGLIKLACLHSHRAGLEGRLTLEAYHDEPTVRWYTELGFQEAQVYPDGIIEMELPPESARSLLSSLSVQG
jgi:GNAT superfamily N-acetyltransferase